MKNQKIIPIFFAVDDTYAPYLSVALASLKDTASQKYFYDINILIDKLSDEYRADLMSYQCENIRIGFCNVSARLSALCSRLHLRDYYTNATYYRFFIPEMFPQYKKGLYLDCDIVITRDIADMFNTPMGKSLLCAVNDEVITDIEVFANYSEIVLDIPRNKYFNAGILVMNLDEMRKMHIENAFAELLGKKTYSVAQDQDYLNVICRGRVKYLSQLWNKTPMPYSNKDIIPFIAHYKINYKPWKYDGVVYGELFWKYAEKTAHYSSLLDQKNSYTKEEMERDSEQYHALERLAERETYDELLSRSAFFGDEFFPIDFFIDSEKEIFLSDDLRVAEAI